MTEQLRLMAVHAHPDDESSKGAATMAKYVSEGVDVLVVTCTGGERGSILNPKLQGDAYIEEHIHEVRKKEMDEAREILGVKQEWLGFVDSGLPEGDPLPPLPEGCFALEDVDEAAGALVKLIRAFRPQVDHDVRRERRLPAPRPHHDPQDLDGGLRRRGGHREVPRGGVRPGVAAAEALLQPGLQPAAHRRAARGAAGARHGVARTGSGWSAGRSSSAPSAR